MAVSKEKKLLPKLRFPSYYTNWEMKRIEECFVFKNGLNKEKEYFGKGTPIINFNDVYHLSGINKSDVNGLVKLSISEKERFAAKKGEVFFTRTSETIDDIGMAAVLLEEIEDCVFSGFVLRATPITEDLDLFFKKYCFSIYSVRKEIVTKSSMTTRALTSGTLLNKVQFCFPKDKLEQQKIASFLTAVDTKIQQLIKKKNLLEGYKKGIMQRLFKQEIRFKKDDGSNYPNWEEKKLGEISNVKDGTHDSPKYVEVGHPLITSKNLNSNGTLNNENISFISDKDFENINKRSKVDIGDIIFGMIGTIGNPVLVIRDDFAIKNVALIKEKKLLLNKFLIHYLDSNLILKQFHKENTGGTQKFLSLGVIRNLIISNPNLEEQQKIATFLSGLDKKIELVNTQLEQTKTFKKGLLQQLFV